MMPDGVKQSIQIKSCSLYSEKYDHDNFNHSSVGHVKSANLSHFVTWYGCKER